MKKPFILKWSRDDMVLSDGSKQTEFLDHDEAIAALESEIAKITMPLARKVIDISEDRHEHYRIAELEVVRDVCGDLMLYGVSDYYLRPKMI